MKTLMSKTAKSLHVLMNQRKEAAAEAKEKEKEVNHSVLKDVTQLREVERNKRLQLYGVNEQKKQEITSAIILELIQICKEGDVPRYVHIIAK